MAFLQISMSLHQIGKNGGSHYSQQPRYRNGQAAHGAFYFADFHGFGGADGVGGGAEGYAFGYGFGDLKEAEDRLGDDVAKDAGDDDDGDSDGHVAAQFFGYAHADGSGDGLGQQGYIFHVGQLHELGQHEDGGQAGQHTNEDSGKDGLVVLLELLEFLIQRNRQANGGGGEEPTQILRTVVVGVVVNMADDQHQHGHDDGDQQWIQDGQFEGFL